MHDGGTDGTIWLGLTPVELDAVMDGLAFLADVPAARAGYQSPTWGEIQQAAKSALAKVEAALNVQPNGDAR